MRHWRPMLPALVLVLVAGRQIQLAKVSALSAWKGGGFGMFSTVDDAPHRTLRVIVEAANRSEEVAIAPSLEDDVARALTLPDPTRLRRLAEAVIARERRYARPVSRVRITVWRHEVDRTTLAMTPVVLRDFGHDAPP
ncbi:hypothetical protein [Luteitalea sp. TBR-22]|uniref:hypothetical protein n=1 Tax=Luteitalea sp. TBR-22 TaxID=2802971 RepID=UPI001EF6015B|nr:hypothetical protein [Luteitalea sp. TBR-22]